MDTLFDSRVVSAFLKIVLSLRVNFKPVGHWDPFCTIYEFFNGLVTLFFVAYDSGVDVEVIRP